MILRADLEPCLEKLSCQAKTLASLCRAERTFSLKKKKKYEQKGILVYSLISNCILVFWRIRVLAPKCIGIPKYSST